MATTNEKIKAFNRLEKETATVWAKLQPVLAQLKADGVQVTKKDNTLTKKAATAIYGAIPRHYGAFTFRVDCSEYNMWVYLRICQDEETHSVCFYTQRDFFACRFDGAKVGEISTGPKIEKRTAAAVSRALKKRTKLREETVSLDSYLRFLAR